MATLAPDSDEAKQINAALQKWRQGDLALDESRGRPSRARTRGVTRVSIAAARFAVAQSGPTGESSSVMGISVWYFVRPRPGEFRALTSRAADQFFSDAGGRIPPDADGLVRYAQVCVDMENRRAVALRRVDFFQIRANQDGSIDRVYQRTVMHDVLPVVMGGLLPSGSPAGVIDAEPKFAQRRLDHMTKWTPTNEDLEALRRLVNQKAGRDIA